MCADRTGFICGKTALAKTRREKKLNSMYVLIIVIVACGLLSELKITYIGVTHAIEYSFAEQANLLDAK